MILIMSWLVSVGVVLTATQHFHIGTQVNALSEQLSAAEAQREALLSERASSLEETQQLRGALQASSQETLEIREELGAAVLREAQLSRQIEELTQQLASDQERDREDESRLSAAVHENALKVSKDLPSDGRRPNSKLKNRVFREENLDFIFVQNWPALEA